MRFQLAILVCFVCGFAAGNVVGDELKDVAAIKVDRSTLTGKVMCGYQGWFNCAGDGAGLGWTHWARNRDQAFAPRNVTVDL